LVIPRAIIKGGQRRNLDKEDTLLLPALLTQVKDSLKRERSNLRISRQNATGKLFRTNRIHPGSKRREKKAKNFKGNANPKKKMKKSTGSKTLSSQQEIGETGGFRGGVKFKKGRDGLRGALRKIRKKEANQLLLKFPHT